MPYIYRYVKYSPNSETDEELIQNSSDYYDTQFCMEFETSLEIIAAVCELVKLRTKTPWLYKVSLDGRLNNNIKPMFMLEQINEHPLFFDFRSRTICERYQNALKFNYDSKSWITPIQKNMVKPPKKR